MIKLVSASVCFSCDFPPLNFWRWKISSCCFFVSLLRFVGVFLCCSSCKMVSQSAPFRMVPRLRLCCLRCLGSVLSAPLEGFSRLLAKFWLKLKPDGGLLMVGRRLVPSWARGVGGWIEVDQCSNGVARCLVGGLAKGFYCPRPGVWYLAVVSSQRDGRSTGGAARLSCSARWI